MKAVLLIFLVIGAYVMIYSGWTGTSVMDTITRKPKA